jgi:hypothetical protein
MWSKLRTKNERVLKEKVENLIMVSPFFLKTPELGKKDWENNH